MSFQIDFTPSTKEAVEKMSEMAKPAEKTLANVTAQLNEIQQSMREVGNTTSDIRLDM